MTRKQYNLSIQKKLVIVCTAIVGCITFVSCARNHPVSPANITTKPATRKAAAHVGPAQHGKALFAENCAKCHGFQGEGLSKEFPIKNVGPDLQKDKFLTRRTDAQLVAFIERGRVSDNSKDKRKIAMPLNGGNPALTDQDIRDIVAYLRQVQKQHAMAK